MASFLAAWLGFALFALSQARHAQAVAAPHRPALSRALGGVALGAALVAAIARDGWGFGILLWATSLTLAAVAVVATLTWRPGWLRPLARALPTRE